MRVHANFARNNQHAYDLIKICEFKIFSLVSNMTQEGLNTNYDPPIIADCKTPVTAPPPLP